LNEEVGEVEIYPPLETEAAETPVVETPVAKTAAAKAPVVKAAAVKTATVKTPAAKTAKKAPKVKIDEDENDAALEAADEIVDEVDEDKDAALLKAIDEAEDETDSPLPETDEEEEPAADEVSSEPRPPAKLVRLQKILSQAGIASRRRAEELIVAGSVQVNGQVVTELGSKADPERDHIRVDGKLLHGVERRRYFLLNKPKGYVTTVSDPEGRPTVMEFFAKTSERLYPVGRLDYLSEGLLLMTNDGELANLLTRAGAGVEKTYLVKVSGNPEEEELERLRAGVEIERGEAGSERVRTAPARIRQVREGDNPWFEVVLTEGRNREIRKIFASIGHFAEKIRRIGYGPLVLDVEPGQMRPLTFDEVDALQQTAAGKMKPRRLRTELALPKTAGLSAEKREKYAERRGKFVRRDSQPRNAGEKPRWQKPGKPEWRPRKPEFGGNAGHSSFSHGEDRPKREWQPRADGVETGRKEFRGDPKPAFSRSSSSRPAFSKPGFSKPGFSKPGFSKPGFSKPGFSKPGFSKPGFDKPRGNSYGAKPRFDKPFNKPFGKPSFDRPRPGGTNSDRPHSDRPNFDRPKFDRPGFAGRERSGSDQATRRPFTPHGEKPAFAPQGDRPPFNPRTSRPPFKRNDRPQGSFGKAPGFGPKKSGFSKPSFGKRSGGGAKGGARFGGKRSGGPKHRG
jgi:23S rRNA pseudouridine2605 synthase